MNDPQLVAVPLPFRLQPHACVYHPEPTQVGAQEGLLDGQSGLCLALLELHPLPPSCWFFRSQTFPLGSLSLPLATWDPTTSVVVRVGGDFIQPHKHGFF